MSPWVGQFDGRPQLEQLTTCPPELPEILFDLSLLVLAASIELQVLHLEDDRDLVEDHEQVTEFLAVGQQGIREAPVGQESLFGELVHNGFRSPPLQLK